MTRNRRNVGRTALGALAASLVGGAALYAAAPHPPRTPHRVRDVGELEAVLDRLVASGNPPGLSVAVVKDGRVAYEGAFGMADAPRGIAATPDTAYHWWSVTKIPTAMAALQLAGRRNLDLDAPVASYLPWFEVIYPSAGSPPIAVGHLLNHSSGLPDPMPAMIGWIHHDDGARDQTELTRNHLPSYARVRFGPGSRTAYSNLNYMVLGAVIEAVTGQAYERYVVEQVLRPLGVREADFVYTPPLTAHEAAGSLPVAHIATPLLPFLLDVRHLVREQKGRLLWLRRTYLDPTPPSGLIGSARDAARLMLAYLSPVGVPHVLPADLVQRMTHEGRVGGQGLGWAVGSAAGRPHVQHAGGGPGFAAMMRLYPEEGLGIALLANGTDLDRGGLADLIASMVW